MKSQQRRSRSEPEIITIAVVSDVHAYHGKSPDTAPSHCRVDDENEVNNPLIGLKRLIADQRIRASMLFCPGDLSDKAEPVATRYAWNQLQDLKTRLKAARLLVATGNHDVDSRHAYNSFDAKGMLQTLSPLYPFPTPTLTDRYWWRHFAIISTQSCRVLVINSSAFHGEGRINDASRFEYEQGRVSDYTLSNIKAALVGSPPPLNILLVHHHPHPHSELRLGDKDLMINGQALTELLGSGPYGKWFILHGHKHHPKLEYAAGGTNRRSYLRQVASQPLLCRTANKSPKSILSD